MNAQSPHSSNTPRSQNAILGRGWAVHIWPSVAAFLFFALALNVRSGYSWGAAILALWALATLRTWAGVCARAALPARARVLAILLVCWGLVAQHDFDHIGAFSNDDVALKYMLAALCMLAVHYFPVRLSWLRLGLILGLCWTLCLALSQYADDGRAEGFTNAINFGAIAAGFVLVAVCLAAVERDARWRWALWAAAVAGAGACLLSMSRGPWLVLFCAPVLWAWLSVVPEAANCWWVRLRKLALGGVLMVVAMVAVLQLPQFGQRIDSAKVEGERWLQAQNGDAALSSIGQRLEQWRLHWALIQERPWTGWGLRGIEQAKRERVGSGLAHPSVLDYGHAHNEVLHMWAQRGAVGLGVLLAVYVVPVGVLWPAVRRRQAVVAERRRTWQALAVAAMSVPLTVGIAGLTQVFFAHNSGDFFYAFSLVFLVGAMRGLEISEDSKSSAEFRV